MAGRLRLHVLATVALAAGLAQPAAARLLLTQDQALALAFPSAQAVERRTAYLTDAQAEAAQKSGRVKIDSRVWSYYVGASTAGPAGYAYFDTHLIRTMPETVMVVLEPDGSVRFVEILAFHEPDDYRTSPRWLRQLQGKTGREDLLIGRALRNMTGATLTSQALADAVRRVLAVHNALHPKKVESPSR
jgi:hypothetical protein